jgi:hypothetical protein
LDFSLRFGIVWLLPREARLMSRTLRVRRRKRKRVNGEGAEYWPPVKSIRTERGPRQRTVACILTLARFRAPSLLHR